jgi:hypothetical protein
MEWENESKTNKVWNKGWIGYDINNHFETKDLTWPNGELSQPYFHCAHSTWSHLII